MKLTIKRKDGTETIVKNAFGWCNGKGTFRYSVLTIDENNLADCSPFTEINWEEVDTIFFEDN